MNWLTQFIFVILRPALGLIILAGLLIFWFLRKKLPQEKYLKAILFSFLLIIISRSFILTILNYRVWSQDLVSYRLLPPHNSIFYFLQYSWQHYWFEAIITILFSLFIFWAIYLLNQKFEQTFFYDEERYLAGLGILITGWPNCLIYLCLVLLLGVIFHFLIFIFNLLKDVNNSRLSLLCFWLPCALLVLLLNDIISKYIGINVFQI